MPRPAIDLESKIFDVPQHTGSLPTEAEVPISHFERSANDAWNLLQYIERNLKRTNVYPSSAERHGARLNRMILLSLCAAFERFLKELAAMCVDHLSTRITDDRFDEFRIEGNAFAAHFDAKTAGHALCESSTWLNCDDVNKRFRAILRPLSGANEFYMFPKPGAGQQPVAEQWRYRVMCTLWQLRHSVAHNDGVITKSDALRLRLYIRAPVEGSKVLWPNKHDIMYIKRFLDETAVDLNVRVSEQLSDVLGALHDSDNSLFAPASEAQLLANHSGVKITIDGQSAIPTN